MNSTRLRHARLRAQHLAGGPDVAPERLVAHLGAVQAQDLAGGMWALGLRTTTTESAVTQLLDDGVILRTHVLRPTWHLVLPGDVHWMLQLTAPRIAVGNTTRLRQLGVSPATVERSLALMEDILANGNHLTRLELGRRLAGDGIVLDSAQLTHVVMSAELERVVVSGRTRGRQTTYALMSERAPSPDSFDRDLAVVELARRYWTGRGPATLADFAWWSGLTLADARMAAGALSLCRVDVDGRELRDIEGRDTGGSVPASAHLLPNWDEYTVAYRHRDHHVEGVAFDPGLFSFGSVLANVVVVDGVVHGSWRRVPTRDGIRVEVRTLSGTPPAHRRLVGAAAARLGRFAETAVTVTWA